MKSEESLGERRLSHTMPIELYAKISQISTIAGIGKSEFICSATSVMLAIIEGYARSKGVSNVKAARELVSGTPVVNEDGLVNGNEVLELIMDALLTRDSDGADENRNTQ